LSGFSIAGHPPTPAWIITCVALIVLGAVVLLVTFVHRVISPDVGASLYDARPPSVLRLILESWIVRTFGAKPPRTLTAIQRDHLVEDGEQLVRELSQNPYREFLPDQTVAFLLRQKERGWVHRVSTRLPYEHQDAFNDDADVPLGSPERDRIEIRMRRRLALLRGLPLSP
jgi:hypothetical protein